jgi:ABC-type multidrug transport system ATPase subunit
MRPSDGPFLSAIGLERAFGARRALAGVWFSLEPGETVIHAGPKGAGKTTQLRSLAGLARPTRGSVALRGRAVRSSDAASRRAIGFVAHQTFLHDDLTLLENLAFAARLYGLSPATGLAAAALERAGLLSRAGDRPASLSRGMQQRAAIARALLHQPRLLLLDEPFTGLDAAAGGALRTLIAEGSSAGVVTMVVTHQPAEAWEVASRVIGLRTGAMAFDEPRAGAAADLLVRLEALAHG